MTLNYYENLRHCIFFLKFVLSKNKCFAASSKICCSFWQYQKRSKPRRPLKKILKDVKDFLEKPIRLPYSYDCDLSTLLVPITFAQAILSSRSDGLWSSALPEAVKAL
jgi:hypothetical protein